MEVLEVSTYTHTYTYNIIYIDTKSNEDDLWLFDLENNSDVNKQGVWKKIPTTGKTPGKRYGHSLAYLKPYFILFGGNVNSKLTNDVWLINLNNVQFSWQKIEFAKKRPEPLPRLYHAVGFSQSGNVMEFADDNESKCQLLLETVL